jgi:twinkle protein
MIKEFIEFIELAENSSPYIIAQCRQFSDEFPNAEFIDYKRVFKALVKGFSYETIVDKYQREQVKLGMDIAKRELFSVLKMEDCIEDMISDLKKGKEKGTPTYIKGLDEAWTWRRGEFNIWTGYTNEGKSQFLRFLCLVKCIVEKTRVAFYAPEDFPAKEFFDDLIHTASGRSTDKYNPLGCIKESTYRRIYNSIKDYFYFVYIRPPENTLINVLKEFEKLIETEEVTVCVIDPIIKINRPKEFMNADDKYAGYVTTLCTDFARQTNISLHLVMHQLTPRMQDNGYFPKPSYYTIKGGGTWGDGTDNILSIQRPVYAKDKIDDQVIFTSQKIKKQKLVGVPMELRFRFDRKKNRYTNFETRRDLFEFSEYFSNPQLELALKGIKM